VLAATQMVALRLANRWVSQGRPWLLTLYAKSRQENAPAHILKALKEELIDDYGR